MCGGLKITRVPFGRTSSAGLLFFLVPGGHERFRTLQHPLVPRRPIVHLRRKGPYGSVNSECEPIVHRRAVCGSERLEVVLETIHPILLWASLAWIFPPDEFSVHQPLREAPGGLSGHGSREQKSPLSHIARVWINRVRLPILLVVIKSDAPAGAPRVVHCTVYVLIVNRPLPCRGLLDILYTVYCIYIIWCTSSGTLYSMFVDRQSTIYPAVVYWIYLYAVYSIFNRPRRGKGRIQYTVVYPIDHGGVKVD